MTQTWNQKFFVTSDESVNLVMFNGSKADLQPLFWGDDPSIKAMALEDDFQLGENQIPTTMTSSRIKSPMKPMKYSSIRHFALMIFFYIYIYIHLFIYIYIFIYVLYVYIYISYELGLG